MNSYANIRLLRFVRFRRRLLRPSLSGVPARWSSSVTSNLIQRADLTDLHFEVMVGKADQHEGEGERRLDLATLSVHGTAFAIADNTFITAGHVYSDALAEAARNDGRVVLVKQGEHQHANFVTDGEVFAPSDLALMACNVNHVAMPVSFEPLVICDDVQANGFPSEANPLWGAPRIHGDLKWTPKTDERALPISPMRERVLIERFASRTSETWVLTNYAGNRDTHILDKLKKIGHRAGIASKTVHALRHSFGAHLPMAGVSLADIADI